MHTYRHLSDFYILAVGRIFAQFCPAQSDSWGPPIVVKTTARKWHILIGRRIYRSRAVSAIIQGVYEEALPLTPRTRRTYQFWPGY
jgi:hypothetical protein